MEDLASIDKDIRRLEEKLEVLDKKRGKAYWLIPIGLILPFLLPFIPRRGTTMAEKYGYVKIVLISFAFLLVVLPISYFVEKNKLDKEEDYLEHELDDLKRRKLKFKID